MKEYRVEVTTSTHGGWGYQIFKGSKLLIDQTMIPAVGGNKGFVTPGEAKAVGLLVVNKLKNKANELPSVLIKELDSLNITY